jgi:IS6 family transposase
VSKLVRNDVGGYTGSSGHFLQVGPQLTDQGLLAIPRRVALRQCKYLNNVIEQDHRTVKKRVWLAKGYGSFQSAWRTLPGIETVKMIRKGRVRWLAKGDAVGQAHFIGELFGLSA